jgi:hypothetical protein
VVEEGLLLGRRKILMVAKMRGFLSRKLDRVSSGAWGFSKENHVEIKNYIQILRQKTYLKY